MVVLCGLVAAIAVVTAVARAANAPRGGQITIAPRVAPGGKKFAFVKGFAGGVGYVEVAAKGAKPRTVYSSSDSCCTELRWASPHLLVLEDDYNVKTVDLDTGRIRTIAGFSNFVVSRDGRWVAGWALEGPDVPTSVGVVAITGAVCRTVPKPANASDSNPHFSNNSKVLRFSRETADSYSLIYLPLSRLLASPSATTPRC